MLRQYLAAACLAVGTLTACASGSAGSGGAAAASPRGSANVITRAELQAARAENLLRAIERLRPALLQKRALTSDGTMGPTVFVDGHLRGDITELAQIATPDVEEVRYLDVAQAKLKLGRHLPAGAIAVVQTTR